MQGLKRLSDWQAWAARQPGSPGARGALPGRVTALLVAALLITSGPLVAPVQNVLAAGSNWQNANGTSTTATGQATTSGSQPGLVFAFNAGVPVTACSSPQGSCVVGEPDGTKSFEVFAGAATATVSFSVTTTAAITCSSALGFKVSFNGQLPYTNQPSIPTQNTCTTPPPTKCPVSDVKGYFEPVQAVWQDDPLDGDHFPDKPGKQLTRNSPTSYTAELPMIQNKPTLLFGIDHAQNALGEAPHDRYTIVIQGTTTGDTQVPVKMKFSGTGAGVTLDYTTEVLGQLYLYGTCGAPRAFKVSLSVPNGAPNPPIKAFLFGGTGPYSLKNQLIGEDGAPTGIEITVGGTVVATQSPITYFVPVRLTTIGGAAAGKALKARSDSLRDQVVKYTPDYWPLRPGGFTGLRGPLIDISARVKAVVAEWKIWAALFTTEREVTVDVLLASLTDAFGLGGILGKVGRTVVVLSPNDMSVLGLGDFDGYAESEKVVFVESTVDDQPAPSYTVAHELVHTMPYVWSSDEMIAQCDVDYHNKDIRIAHGFRVTRGGVEFRQNRDPYAHLMGPGDDQWADQCTYWNLTTQLQRVQDPLVVIVRGRLAMQGTKVKGQLFPAYELMSETDLKAVSGGTWAIVLKSASGATLGRYPFTPQWESSTRTRKVISFAYRLPYSTSVRRIDLVGPSGVISTLKWSARAPTVKITKPAAGARVTPVGGKVRVTWTGQDLDRNPLRYTVLYSHNGGATWEAQSVEQVTTTFDVTLAPGRSHKVKVVVTDGTRSAESIVAFGT